VYKELTVGVVVPARDEEGNVGAVVRELLALRGDGGEPLVDDFVVCDNGSADATARRARAAGARVVREETPGYGIACLTALGALRPVDVVLFTDGDRTFVAGQSVRLLDAIAAGADFAVGSRALGRREPGALSPPQILGNRLAGFLIRVLWGRRVTDLGPYRAIRAEALRRLDMRDTAYGWTVEMQVKAAQHHLRMVEAPVDTVRRRSGASKVGGTVRGVIGASVGILSTITRLRWRQARATFGGGGACGEDPGPRKKRENESE
jgi:glycosyltransferase involved in cell wall biosynthesis